MTTLTLSNGEASATILTERGGLMSSLVLADGRGEPVSLLWLSPDFNASGSGWPMGGLPVLFPFAGRVFHEGQPLLYELQGTVRNMPLHGFAYGLPWQATRLDEATAELTLKDSAATHLLYPFAFTLKARYRLTPSALALTLAIESHGALGGASGPMPVAAGLHPFFRMPLRPFSRSAECVLETSAQHKIRVTPQGMAGKHGPFPAEPNEREPRLDDPFFHNLILSEHTHPRLALHDRDGRLTTRLSWGQPDTLRYVVLWSQAGQGFYCAEPWMGLPDPLAQGHGAGWLEAGESLTLDFALSLEDHRIDSP